MTLPGSMLSGAQKTTGAAAAPEIASRRKSPVIFTAKACFVFLSKTTGFRHNDGTESAAVPSGRDKPMFDVKIGGSVTRACASLQPRLSHYGPSALRRASEALQPGYHMTGLVPPLQGGEKLVDRLPGPQLRFSRAITLRAYGPSEGFRDDKKSQFVQAVRWQGGAGREERKHVRFGDRGCQYFPVSEKPSEVSFGCKWLGGEVKEGKFMREGRLGGVGGIVNNFLKMGRGVAQRLSYPLW